MLHVARWARMGRRARVTDTPWPCDADEDIPTVSPGWWRVHRHAWAGCRVPTLREPLPQ